MADEQVRWLPQGPMSRVASVHRWGAYRWVVALLIWSSPRFWAIGQDRAGLLVLAGPAALLLLPGGRERSGITAHGVTVWGLWRRRTLAWDDIAAVHLTMTPAFHGSLPGARLCLYDPPRTVDLRGLPRWGRWRTRALTTLAEAADQAGVAVVGDGAMRRWFRDVPVDAWGGFDVRPDGTWRVVPEPSDQPDGVRVTQAQREARRALMRADPNRRR